MLDIIWSSGSCSDRLLSLGLFLCCSLWPSPGKPAPGLWNHVYFPSCPDLGFSMGQRVWVGHQWGLGGTVDHRMTVFRDVPSELHFWPQCTYFRDVCAYAFQTPQGCVGDWTVLVDASRHTTSPFPGVARVFLGASSVTACADACLHHRRHNSSSPGAGLSVPSLLSASTLTAFESQKLHSESGMPVLFLEHSRLMPPNAWGKANTEVVLWIGCCFCSGE